MSTPSTSYSSRREPELLGQTVVVIGGSGGIGLGSRPGEHGLKAPS